MEIRIAKDLLHKDSPKRTRQRRRVALLAFAAAAVWIETLPLVLTSLRAIPWDDAFLVGRVLHCNSSKPY